MLWPAVPVYAGVVTVKNWLRDVGVLRMRRLGHPVISVGSVSAGGAGKTPVVVLLAELLGRRGFEVRILTRGYRRKGVEVGIEARTDPPLKGETWGTRIVADARVDPAGDAGEFGDEPMLMARRLPKASVWVGSDRHRVGLVTEKDDAPGAKVVYLLDDGFQHRKLARDVDIVLLTRQDVEDRLLPVGNLREPLRAVGRAGVVVVREDEISAVGAVGEGMSRWVIRRRLVFPEGAVVPRRPVVFCGLARPEGFLVMLRAEGIVPVGVSIFRDHHAYSERDVEGLVKMARANGADGFLTTEKDAVKLSARMMERLGVVVVAQLWVELRDEELRMAELLKMVEVRFARRGRG